MAKTGTALAPALVWFRDDLRLGDHPALEAALRTGRPLICVYVDDVSPGLRPLGAASRWWLHGSLTSLAERIEAIGGRLDISRGAAGRVIPDLAKAAGVVACFWNRRYEAAAVALDRDIEAALVARGTSVETFNGTLLHEPDEVRSKSGGPFRVFTPFRRASLALGAPGHPLPAPSALPAARWPVGLATLSIQQLGLLPEKPDWAGGLRETWTPGEPAAQQLLSSFLAGGLARYADDRNRPALTSTSRLSPHLRFGEISPRQVLAKARHAGASGSAAEAEVEKFASEVIWRDFAYNLLVQHPDIATKPVQPMYAEFPYRQPTAAERHAWCFGQTGYPVVDAGMRQLWRTGVMHNRVRMIAASFLIKHLLVDWRVGEAWFWDTLCDADPASNPVNWQWVAGSGADPAPYFRIFNPVLQGEKFDPEGVYVRQFVPELAKLPPKWVHQPWAAPRSVLDQAGVILGRTYPLPIIEHEPARARALATLALMRRRAPPAAAAGAQ